jgi:IPTL-CTERM motif
VFNEIASGTLSNTVAPGCLDDGAALQWHETFVGQAINISTGVSFTGNAVPVGPTAVVPTLSVAGIAALVVLLAAVGYVLARKTSLGA